jgi:RHS repeat-associated protein
VRTLKTLATGTLAHSRLHVILCIFLIAGVSAGWTQGQPSSPKSQVTLAEALPPAESSAASNPDSRAAPFGISLKQSIPKKPSLIHSTWTPWPVLGDINFSYSILVDQGTNALEDGCIPTAVTGQTATLLPDDSLLLIGGLGQTGPMSLAYIQASGLTRLTRLGSALSSPRAWHTSTLLPDGNVLVFGGVDSAGNVVATAESFSPEARTFNQLTTPGPTPRAYHSATVLTDGTVLIAGGVSSDGFVLSNAELWDPQTGTRTPLPAQLNVPRRNHCAVLLADGKVLLWGGTDTAGNRLSNGDVYDLANQSFSLVESIPSEAQPGGTAPILEASTPENGAQNVPLLGEIALRFSEHLNVKSVSSNTVSLNGPQGSVPIRVVPAERGILAFITCSQALLPGTTYSVLLDGLTDTANRLLLPTQIVFTTAPSALNSGVGISDVSGGQATDDSWRHLPSLQASPGVTAIAGQVLQLNGRPLANVTIRLDGSTDQAQTDSTGRFLLRLLGSVTGGHRQIVIDGKTASVSTSKTYGLFEYGLNVKTGITNLLPFIVWMPVLDTAHTVTIPVPTKQETIVTTPLLPGLELRIPAGTIIYNYYGQVVHQISITPIPVDRPPFPLPNVPVPIYFTIQPGGAWLTNINGGRSGAQLYYPNTYHKKVGTVYQFWNYNPDGQGWYIYGLGRVAPGGQQIIPDPGVLIYGFSGAMVGDAGAPPNGPPPCNGTDGGGCSVADPVDLSTGLFVYTHTDLTLSDVIPLILTRTYRPNDPTSRAFGIGTTHPYDVFIISPDQDQHIHLILPDGGRVMFSAQQNGIWICNSSPTTYFGATIVQGSLGTTWVLTRKDGTVLTFPEDPGAKTPQQEAIIAWQDRYGNSLTFTRDSNSNLTRLSSPNGRYLQFTLDSSGRITQATDNIGRIVQYAYDGNGRLSTVTDAKGGVTTYTYDGSSSNMVSITNPRQITYVKNQYDSNNRVTQQFRVDGSIFTFSYTLDNNNNVVAAQVTDPRGNVRQTTFNSSGYLLTDTRAFGTPQQELTTVSRDPSTNLINSKIDALNRTTSYTYGSLGNVLSVTQLYGTPGAVTTYFTYATFSQIASITDPLNHTTSFGYDNVGDLITLTDPLQHQWSFAYNSLGQQLSATDPLSNTTTLAYENGNLTSVTDPLERTTTLGKDGAGRLLSVIDPLGITTQYQYEALDKVTGITDPLGGVTSFVYDKDENLLTVTDALNHSTNYGYDNLDRLSARTDPLLHTETYTYDLNGNVQIFTDRRGKQATFTYDPLDRRTQVTYADGSSTSYTYDLGDRMVQAKDSISGTINRSYDGLDRLTSEATSEGSVSYTYDAASRRSTMTVAGQPAISYAFDNANRLLQIAQASSVVSLTYDNANRRLSLTLPNNITENYAYDHASELTGITYELGTTMLGSLTYGYDADRRRISMGGTYARMALGSSPVSSLRIYNADNQLVKLGNTILSYDANGNLTNDGVNTYEWDARNQLISLNAGASARFQYDAFGRRVNKIVMGAPIAFLYDLINPVEELANGIPTATMLLSPAVDDFFSRTDAVGTRNLITDGLGNTLALTDSTGILQTQYTYGAFGDTTTTGHPSSSSYQYTRRENDNTGLYYYRARYYSPALQRFIEEDPLGLRGGDVNLYAYVRNSPMNHIDPRGLEVTLCEFVCTVITGGVGGILGGPGGAIGGGIISLFVCDWVCHPVSSCPVPHYTLNGTITYTPPARSPNGGNSQAVGGFQISISAPTAGAQQ